MATRTVTGTIYSESGAAWASQSVVFYLQTGFATTATETVLTKTYTLTTAADGTFTATLAVPAADAWQYRCVLPDGSSFVFTLAAGSATTLEAIIADQNLSATVSASTLAVLIGAHAALTTGVHGATGTIVDTSGTPVDNDYAKFTAAGTIEGRSYAEARTDLNVEDGADVTDATNVNAAGATMNTDADVSGNTWVVNEDDMTSDLDTKVPTQQSVKAYVDAVDHSALIPKDSAILQKSGGYELAAGDEAKSIFCDGTFAINLPDSLDAGFQAVIVNKGSGTITLTADTTLNSKDAGVTLPNQHGAATVIHEGSNVWFAFGDLE